MSRSNLAPVLHSIRRLLGLHAAEQTTDRTLLDRFASVREEAAFAALVQRHGPMVWGVCRRVLREEHAAEDAYQATFLVFARKARSIRNSASVAGWLHRVAYRLALAAKASPFRQREEIPDNIPDENPTDPLQEAGRREARRMLDEELNRLPEKYRLPVVLCFFEGRTHAEAAVELHWPVGTVAGRLARAKELLHGRLTRRGMTLSVASLGALLAGEAAQAAPPAVSALVVKAALAFASGRAVEALASAKVLTLANGMLATAFGKRGGVILAVLLLSFVGALAAYKATLPPKVAETPTLPDHPKAEETPTLPDQPRVIVPAPLDIEQVRRGIPIVILDQAQTEESRGLLRRFENSDTFRIVEVVASAQSLHDAIGQGKAIVGIKIPEDYSRRLLRGDEAQVQLLVNGNFYSVPGEALANVETQALLDAVKAVRELGGGLTVDAKRPGKPVVGVSYGYTPVPDASLRELNKLKSLQALDFTGGYLTDSGLKELKELKSLQTLNLRSCKVTGAGLKELTGLHILNLSSTWVTEAGLGELKELKNLRSLDLSQAPVTDAGLKGLKELTGLQWLDLSLTGVTDVGLKELKELKNLHYLDLSIHPNITDAGVKELKEALPGLWVIQKDLDPYPRAPTLPANRQLIAQVARASRRHRIATRNGRGHRQRPRLLVSVNRSTTDTASASPPGHSGRPSASRARCRSPAAGTAPYASSPPEATDSGP